jgi:hypothetical protein
MTLDLLETPPEPKQPKVNVTSAMIRQGMLATWVAPEYAIMWEVGDATGARHTRFADAVIMSLWPSRGLELHGVEIKVSRSDWRREAADPKKAETIARFCDRWYVHTAPNVVYDLAELPPAWGLREFDGKKWKTVREASRNPQPQAIDRTFLAALLRRADAAEWHWVHEEAEKMIAADREAYEKRIEREVERRLRKSGEAEKALAEFEAASGLKLSDWGFWNINMTELGLLVKTVKDSGITKSWDGMIGARDAALKAFDTLDQALKDSGIPLPEPNVRAELDRFTKRRGRMAR